MSETKFTKGPWAAKVWTCGRRSVYKTLSTGHLGIPEIAEVWPTHDEDEHRANTNLIAAAPEMYERLERTRNMLQDDGGYDEWIAEIDDLLVKARGES